MDLLNVDELQLIGEGGYKVVYQHPTDNKKVIKLMRPQRIAEDGTFKKHGRFKKHSMQGMYRQFRREIIQYLELCKNNYKIKDYQFPVETPYDFLPTSIGLGITVEKIISPSGGVESLANLVENNKFDSKHLIALEKFFQDCIDLHVVFGEVNANGILYTEKRNNRPEFVLVDGIGEKLVIPLRSFFKKNNTRYINKVKKEIFNQLNLSRS